MVCFWSTNWMFSWCTGKDLFFRMTAHLFNFRRISKQEGWMLILWSTHKVTDLIDILSYIYDCWFNEAEALNLI